jgi:hypothetical protein
VRGDPFDPSVKEGLDLDLYERLSRRVDARYPPDEARGGWKGARTRARREINRRRFEYIVRQARGGPSRASAWPGEREYVLTEEGNIHGCELIGDVLGNVRDAASTGRASATPRRRARSSSEARAPQPLHPRVQRADDDPLRPRERAAGARGDRRESSSVGAIPPEASKDATPPEASRDEPGEGRACASGRSSTCSS